MERAGRVRERWRGGGRGGGEKGGGEKGGGEHNGHI